MNTLILKFLASSVIALVVISAIWLGTLVDQKVSAPTREAPIPYRVALVSTTPQPAQPVKVVHAPADSASAVQQRMLSKPVRLETQ